MTDNQNQRPRRRLLVIVNGLSAHLRSRQFAATLDALRDLGCVIEERRTEAPGDPLRLAGAARDVEADAIVVAGGDGTIDEVINGLLGPAAPTCGAASPSDARAPERALPPLAIIPLGTANVLACEIGLDLDPQRVAKAIVSGPAKSISLGQLRGVGADGVGDTTRLFTLMAGAGFDAHVVDHVSLALKARIKKGAYVWETLRQLFRFPFPTYTVTLDGSRLEATSIVAANGRCYGGRFVIAPRASLELPHFDLVLFKRPGAWHALRYAVALGTGRLHRLRDVEILTGIEVTVEGPDGEPVHAGGDVVAYLPVTLTLLPSALDLVMPR